MAAADWDELGRIPVPATGLPSVPNNASAVVFDDLQELLWIGNSEGRIESYYGVQPRGYASFERYTSVKAHLGEGPVKQLLSHEKGILSISSKSVHLVARNGITLWHLQDPQMIDLRCMCFTSIPNQLLLAGCQPLFFIVDTDKGQVVEQRRAASRYTILRKSRHICAATDDGKIHILSLADFCILKVWDAHATAVNDMDTRGDFLVTCGFSVRGHGPPVVDPLAKVYDLMNLNSLPSIPVPAGAAYIRLHPKLQTTSFVASQTGQMHILDIMNPDNIIFKQANVNFMLGLEISSSGDAAVISDSPGLVYLWGSPSQGQIKFNDASRDTSFADSHSRQPPHVDWNGTPLNTIGMPYYTEHLLSAWPRDMVFEIGAPPISTEPMLLSALLPAEMGYVGPNLNPRKLHRYQSEDTRGSHIAASLVAPKFLSEQARKFASEDSPPHASSTVEALAGLSLNGRAQTEEQRTLKYNKVEIKYSRFGVEDFDFHYFNKTQYSGLETHISNSFINSLLQLYKFVPLIRNTAIQHAATSCITANCLLCEFGFLFDMLEKACGQNCQATNLLRTFSWSREAASLNLFESSAILHGVSLSAVIQSVNRFFLKQMALDHATMTGSTDGVDEILATKSHELIRCIYCNTETTKNATSYVYELQYPQIDPKHYRPNMVRFSAVLKASIERETKSRAWCNMCKRYQQLAIRKAMQQLPLVLMLNTALVNPSARAFWEQPGWLPSEIGLIIQERGIYCFEGSDLALHVRNNSRNLVVYELVGYVAEIDTNDREQPHLVSMVNVEVSSPQSSGGSNYKTFSDWHLFNDFLVSPVDVREAIHFNKAWKMPSIVCYQVKSGRGKIDNSWKQNLDTALLFQQYSINGHVPNESVHVFSHTEAPISGMHIALDTEFVELDKAEINIKADGSQETVRPEKSGLARVSVLRGQGQNEGMPIIDDYIHTNETVVDYKTQYSGIRPGDLNSETSPHNLVPLKVAYKKLWLLLNLGCVFVGHGLTSDFRKANIHVPKLQTIDTQHLYLPAGKVRRLSLRYLAWALFKEYIQEEPAPVSELESPQVEGHDSIEDARMALRLWRKFQEFEEQGIVEQMVEEIYKRGALSNWKPPLRNIAGSLITEGGSSTFASGRNTPDIGAAGGAATPVPRAPGVGFRYSADSTGSGVAKESPLR